MVIPILNGGKKQEFPNILYARKIKCPRHYLLKPNADPYLRVLNPKLKNVSDWVVKKYGIKKWMIKYDAYGNRKLNPASFYQPEVSASFVVHQVYDPKHPICQKCRGRCLEGIGNTGCSVRSTAGRRLFN
jgi:hypothetical protein